MRLLRRAAPPRNDEKGLDLGIFYSWGLFLNFTTHANASVGKL